jgi:hypothetical protein
LIQAIFEPYHFSLQTMRTKNKQGIVISKKKPTYPVLKPLNDYIHTFHRFYELPLEYEDLMRYESAFPLLDEDGNDTLWQSVSYGQSFAGEIFRGLLEIYAILTSGGVSESIQHLSVHRIDYCLFGNSHPFRIKIINLANDNYDYYYIKKADASRIYGLELEHILSPNKINYFVFHQTLVEEHIMGIPGDIFPQQIKDWKKHSKVRLAKEFVKFNERTFFRLLGDMRDYNFVVDMTPDFDQVQYRIRAIDFDQQSYEGNPKIYMPQFFKENNPYVQLAMEVLTEKSIKQYQKEERALTFKRIQLQFYQFKQLMKTMSSDTISTSKKIEELAQGLNEYHKTKLFSGTARMGQIVQLNLQLCLGIESVD